MVRNYKCSIKRSSKGKSKKGRIMRQNAKQQKLKNKN